MVNVQAQVQEKRGEAVEKQTKLASARSFWQQRPEKPFLLPDCGRETRPLWHLHIFRVLSKLSFEINVT